MWTILGHLGLNPYGWAVQTSLGLYPHRRYCSKAWEVSMQMENRKRSLEETIAMGLSQDLG